MLTAAWITLNILDMTLTHRILTNGGQELNLFLSGIMAVSYPLAALLKIGLAIGVAYILRKQKRLLRYLVIGIGIVCLWNFSGVMM